MLNSAEHETILAINNKIPAIVGILIFMSRKIAFYVLGLGLFHLSMIKAKFLYIFVLISI